MKPFPAQQIIITNVYSANVIKDTLQLLTLAQPINKLKNEHASQLW
jgi:hypothetical protein